MSQYFFGQYKIMYPMTKETQSSTQSSAQSSTTTTQQIKSVGIDTTSTNTLTITSNYNTMKSSLVAFDEQVNLNKFNTYSAIVIKKYMSDIITSQSIQQMITQLCALAELVWANDKQCGETKKYNVKLQINNFLCESSSTQSSSTQIAVQLLDTMIDNTIKTYTTKQLISMSYNILKISKEVYSCIKGCM
ncbi:Conserved_hypothetical protein [Hexamita inflata]|uniref:Uncharacterized protein n=1 Tax=Hexamita inflata TaxID=28002 RepID=A0ABP1M4B4_9EUKA